MLVCSTAIAVSHGCQRLCFCVCMYISSVSVHVVCCACMCASVSVLHKFTFTVGTHGGVEVRKHLEKVQKYFTAI